MSKMTIRVLDGQHSMGVKTVVAIRHMAELAEKKLAEQVALGKVPEGSGPEIPEAPARGPVVQFTPMKGYPDGEDGYKFKPSGHLGRKALRRADAFDRMMAGSAKNGRVAFTQAQIDMGRTYGNLFEKHECAGVKCSSLEAVQGGGGQGGEYIDAVLRDREQLSVLHRRIGDGMAMVVRRRRKVEGVPRINISDRRVVDAVCIHGLTISEVLVRDGWSKKGSAVAALAQALREALDRMAGPVRAPRMASVKYGQQAGVPFG